MKLWSMRTLDPSSSKKNRKTKTFLIFSSVLVVYHNKQLCRDIDCGVEYFRNDKILEKPYETLIIIIFSLLHQFLFRNLCQNTVTIFFRIVSVFLWNLFQDIFSFW